MAEHRIGNQYKLLGHVLILDSISGIERCKLSCHSDCCTAFGVELECNFSDLDNMELVLEVPSSSDIDWRRGDTAEVKEGWARAGTRFNVLGPAVFQEQWWVPITDPVEEDPSYYKEASLKKIEGDR